MFFVLLGGFAQLFRMMVTFKVRYDCLRSSIGTHCAIPDHSDFYVGAKHPPESIARRY